MANVTPIQQPPLEDLRNALQIATATADVMFDSDSQQLEEALESIERLLRHALAQLGEPNAAMLAATKDALATHPHLAESLETPESFQHYVRDTAALLLNAQLRGGL